MTHSTTIEALAIFHQLIFDEWASGTLVTPWARIKVGEQNYFGVNECGAGRKAASSHLPKHAAVGGWKHRALLFVEPDGLPPMSKDRDAEQGDVDGPSGVVWHWEWSQRRPNCTLPPWIGTNDPVQDAADSRLSTRWFRKYIGLTDQWYVDDGDILGTALSTGVQHSQR